MLATALLVPAVKPPLPKTPDPAIALRAELEKKDELLRTLLGRDVNPRLLEMKVTLTFYSLSPQECDGDPDTAAHGPSRPFMAAITPRVAGALGLKPGDKVAVVSDDGEVGAIVVYWDKLNSRYDDENRVDIVAPSAKVAKRWGVRPGRIIRL